MVQHLLCRDAICAVRKGLACMCVFGVSKLLFVLGGGVKGVCAARGLGCVCLKAPEGVWISSCPFILSWKDCIRSIWGRETCPSGSGAKGGKTYDTASQIESSAVRYTLKRNSLDGENDSRTHQRHGWVLSGPPRWRSWSGRQRWVQQTSCCTGTQHKSYPASCTAQSLPRDRIEWCLVKHNKMLLHLWMNWQANFTNTAILVNGLPLAVIV